MRLPAFVALLVLVLTPLAGVVAQETERVGPPVMVWAVPRLQLYLEDGERELLRGIDATVAVPLTPRTNVTATYSWDTELADRISAYFNYDRPFAEDYLVRGSVGVVRADPSIGVSVHRSFSQFGVGAYARTVEGNIEGGVMLTRAVPWGVKLGRPSQLKRRESPDWPSGAGDVGQLGARAALVYHGGGTPDEFATTTAYFPTYQRHSWPREGQSVQGVAYTGTDFAPPAKPAWRYQTEGPVRASAAIVDGVAYVGSYDGWLYALDLVLGRRLWRFPAESAITGAPAWLDGRLYFGTEAGEVFCVSQPKKGAAPAGQLVWRYRTSAAVMASPLVTESGLVIVGSCDGYIYALDRNSGQLVWKISTGGPVLASASKLAQRVPAGVNDSGQPTARSGGVLVGSSDGKLYAIEEVKGQVIWTFAADGPITAPAVAVGDRTYLGTRSGSVYALDGPTGKQLWSGRINGSIGHAPALDEKRAYFTTTEGMVHAVDITSGRSLWQTDLKSPVAAAPTLVRGELMYVASGDGRLWTMDRPTGKVLNVHRESEALTTCAAIADGHLVVGGDGGTVFAYVPGKGELSPSSGEAGLPTPTLPTTPAVPAGPTVITPVPPTAPPVPAGPAVQVPQPPSGTVTPSGGAAAVTGASRPSTSPTQPAVTQPATAPAAPAATLTPPSTTGTVAVKPGSTATPAPADFPSPVVAPSGTIQTTPPPATTVTPPATTPITPVVTPPVTPPAAPATKPGDATAPASRIPLLTLLVIPADGRTPTLLTNQDYLYVGGRIATGSGVVSVRVNGLETPIKNGEYQTQINFPGKGEYLLLVEAIDRDGNSTPYRRAIRVLGGMDAVSPEKMTFRQREGSTITTIVPGLRALQAVKYSRTVEIRNAQGQLVHNWVAPGNEPMEVNWNGTNANGVAVTAGDYEIIYILSGDHGPIAWIRQPFEIQE